MRKITDQTLLQKALEARRSSYSPYSHFAVGAALLTKSGKIYTGANIENASYGLSMCAERVALFRAVAEGEHKFLKIAIVGEKKICPPCGACRQVLFEFAPDLEIILGTSEEIQKIISLRKLLPEPFQL